MSRTTLQAPRGKDIFMLDPDELVLVLDKAHPLYDARVELPLDKELVLNVDRYGVKAPVWGRKNGKHDDGRDRVEIVAGRQRVRAAREVNKRRRAAGEPLILVPTLIQHGTDADMYALMVLEHEGRQNDDPITRAQKAHRLVAHVGENAAALAFGKSVATVKRWIALLDLDGSVQERIQRGDVSAYAAASLAELPREEQRVVVEEQLTEGGEPTAAPSGKVRRIVAGRTNSKLAKAKQREFDALDALKKTAVKYALGKSPLADLKEKAEAYGRAVAEAHPKRVDKLTEVEADVA